MGKCNCNMIFEWELTNIRHSRPYWPQTASKLGVKFQIRVGDFCQTLIIWLKSVSFKKTVEISGTWEICTKFPHMIFVVIMFLYVCISAFKAQRIIFYQCYSIFNVNNQNRLIAKDLLINLSKWFYISLDFSWNTFFFKNNLKYR